MDVFEYGYVRLTLVGTNAILNIDVGDTPREIVIPGAGKIYNKVIGYYSNGDEQTRSGSYLKQHPLNYLQPQLNELGKEGWEVVAYKSSDKDDYGEALLKRKIQQGG